MGSVGVFLFLVAGGALYYNYVVSHQDYVIDRNFRLLAMHGELIVDTIKNLEQVFRSALVGTDDSRTAHSSQPENHEPKEDAQSQNPGTCVSDSFHEMAKISETTNPFFDFLGNGRNAKKEKQDRIKIAQALCKSPWLRNVSVLMEVAKGYQETFEFTVNAHGTRSITLNYQPRLKRFKDLHFQNATKLLEGDS